jgi:nucleotide-binding universal stress UspA family protein
VNPPRSADASIRRILVALDASVSSLAALEAAVALASRVEAELIGLFVEDVNLLKLAALPFACEVGFPSARRRRLESIAMERSLRAQAARARAALIAAAERWSVRCSFHVVRGEVTAQVLEAATEVDLLVLGRTHGWRASSTSRVIVGAAARPVLLLSPDMPVRPPVASVYDGSAESARALLLARRLVQAESGSLTVVIVARDADDARRLRQQIAAQLAGSGLAPDYVTLFGADAVDVALAVRRRATGTLVLAANLRLKSATLEELLSHLDCAVLLVR